MWSSRTRSSDGVGGRISIGVWTIRWVRSAGLSQIHPHRIACARLDRSTTWMRARVPGLSGLPPTPPLRRSRTYSASMPAGVRSPTSTSPMCGCRYLLSTDLVWRAVVGAHPISAIANQASRSSLIGERTPTARLERTLATISASSCSAWARVPLTVAVRSMRRPVSGSVATNTRSSQEPVLR